ncbi:protein FAM114A2 isoform X2 [Lingula anatina]|uniref:Protein FAM114A2 isoform X2 n=1 Tax=Lingula anatina TaxID=7574 RepID=A0A2R2MM39_LINAN|nr:protein FAM114A2 isoform X2 [Lingula anatina]|eukprot:XP_023931122.1 protein FAM114A2 isoform X2 [Lingula anatina]
MSDSEEEFASADEGEEESTNSQPKKSQTGQLGKKEEKTKAKGPGVQSVERKESANQSGSRTQQLTKSTDQKQKAESAAKQTANSKSSVTEKDDKGSVGQSKANPGQQQPTGKGKKVRKGKGAKKAAGKTDETDRNPEPVVVEKPETTTEKETEKSDTELKSTTMDVELKDNESGMPQETTSQPSIPEQPTDTAKAEVAKPMAELTAELSCTEPSASTAGGGVQDKQTEKPHSMSPQDGAKSIFDKLAGATHKEEKNGEKGAGSWGSWGGWGTSLLSTASKSVSTFTSQVGEGFSTVLETVEASLGAPSPEELANIEKAEEAVKEGEGEEGNKQSADESKQPENKDQRAAEKSTDDKGTEDTAEKPVTESSQEAPPEQDGSPSEAEGGAGGLGGWFSSFGKVTKKLEDTGKNIMTGGLDVLESIGKKTMDVISEKDPGFAHTKGLFKDKGSKPNLSQMLREAKEEAEEKAKMEEEHKEAQKAHFGTLFDEHQGLARLEALEMLSNQSEAKVQGTLGSLTEDQLQSIKLELVMIKEAFQLEDLDEPEDDEMDHNFAKLMTEHLLVVHAGTTPDKLNKVQSKIREYLKDSKEEQESGSKQNAKDLHRSAIQSLAELTSAAVGQFHKAGELLLLQQDDGANFADRASSLANLTRVLCTEVGIISNKFTQCMNAVAANSEDPDSINPLITNVYLEAGNSATYIQDAFQLLLPVMQMAALQSHANRD